MFSAETRLYVEPRPSLPPLTVPPISPWCPTSTSSTTTKPPFTKYGFSASAVDLTSPTAPTFLYSPTPPKTRSKPSKPSSNGHKAATSSLDRTSVKSPSSTVFSDAPVSPKKRVPKLPFSKHKAGSSSVDLTSTSPVSSTTTLFSQSPRYPKYVEQKSSPVQAKSSSAHNQVKRSPLQRLRSLSFSGRNFTTSPSPDARIAELTKDITEIRAVLDAQVANARKARTKSMDLGDKTSMTNSDALKAQLDELQDAHSRLLCSHQELQEEHRSLLGLPASPNRPISREFRFTQALGQLEQFHQSIAGLAEFLVARSPACSVEIPPRSKEKEDPRFRTFSVKLALLAALCQTCMTLIIGSDSNLGAAEPPSFQAVITAILLSFHLPHDLFHDSTSTYLTDQTHSLANALSEAYLYPIHIATGTPFDSRVMIDALGSRDRSLMGETVLCTVELGLTKAEPHEDGRKAVLKPKVLLRSSLERNKSGRVVYSVPSSGCSSPSESSNKQFFSISEQLSSCPL
ncbi:hypothetical protein DL96DRAFT_1611893 [Flagelloscypha sp. PMI_526]|nr:hypothetical protein DL96DRAFT_1611893 [Flagelloscypha sp. PMI_526]